MSYVIAAPEMMTAAAADVAGIGTALSEAHLAAARPTVGLVPAAADEVSAAVTSVFSSHAQAYQGLAGKAAAFHEHFVQTLKTSAGSYAGAEAAAAASLQHVTAGVASMSHAAAGVPGWYLSLVSLLSDLYNNVFLKLPLGIQGFINSITRFFQAAFAFLAIFGAIFAVEAYLLFDTAVQSLLQSLHL